MATAGDELRTRVDAELNILSINTYAEVQSFRVPGPRDLGNMKTVVENIQTTLGRQWVSRKRVRRDAFRLWKEGQL